ncbi:MAG: LptF/LptG family permease, partial [Holosporales bacterium]|nr:LptF/LptG family permease [Holosporales bacterium]
MRFNPSVILFRYMMLSYLKYFCVVIFIFFAITSMIEYMELVRKFSIGHIGISHKTILELTIFHSISTISSFFPFTAFAGTVLFFSVMHAKLEITVTKVLGLSVWDIAKSLICGGLIIGIIYLTIFDSISVFSVNRIEKIETKIKNKNLPDNITVTNKGVWFRDIFKDSSYVIYARSFVAEFNSLSNVRFFKFDINNHFQESIYSEKAYIKDKNWNLFHAKVIDLSGNKKEVTNLFLPTTLSLAKINKMTTNPKSISIWSISKYISMIDKVGLSSIKYKVYLFYQISSIYQMIALTLLATVFGIGYNIRNSRRYIVKVVIALSISFPLHFSNNILIALGENGNIPIW